MSDLARFIFGFSVLCIASALTGYVAVHMVIDGRINHERLA